MTTCSVEQKLILFFENATLRNLFCYPTNMFHFLSQSLLKYYYVCFQDKFT